MNKNIFLYSVLIIIINWVSVKTEKIYPLVTDLEPLIKTQSNVINVLEDIVKRRKKVLILIETKFKRYSLEHKKIKENLDCYLDNSFIKFILTKRMSVDLDFLQLTLNKSTEFKRNRAVTYPTAEDLEEAINMISRLQSYYILNVTQLANGFMNTSYSKDYTEIFLPMTVSDCCEIGRAMYKSTKEVDINYKQGLKWFLEAIRLHDKEKYVYDCRKVDIIKNICEGYKALGDHKKNFEWVKKMIALKPSSVRELELKEYTHQLLSHHIQKAKQQRQNEKIKKTTLKINPVKEAEKCLKGLSRKTYKMICRGEVYIAPSVSKRLNCWYDAGHLPFTKLARFRAEQLYIQPNVYLFHNVVSDAAIETLKHLAVPALTPLLAVNGPRMMTSMVYLISKGAELNTSESKKISRRISDFTGLSAASSQFLVSNYGVGGFYTGHVDGPGIPDRNRVMKQFNLTDADTEKIEKLLVFLKTFHRIASVIIYLSEVEQGGATVFPVLGLSQFPVKGAALFWSNLLPSGDMDYATCHGVCPVLRGSRWVASQFIDNGSQMFHQPCKVKTTSRRIEDIPYPVLRPKPKL